MVKETFLLPGDVTHAAQSARVPPTYWYPDNYIKKKLEGKDKKTLKSTMYLFIDPKGILVYLLYMIK